MDRMFNPQKINSYSSDELFEFVETGVVTLELLKKIGLNEPSLFELEMRIKTFREIKEYDDWNSVKDFGKEKLELFLSKYKLSKGELWDKVHGRIEILSQLDSLEDQIENIKKSELRKPSYIIQNLMDIKRTFKNLISVSSPQEQNRIEKDLKEIEKIFSTLRQVESVLAPEEEREYNYNVPPDAAERGKGSSSGNEGSSSYPDSDSFRKKISYMPQRLLKSFRWNFFKKENKLCNSAVFAPSEIAKGDDLFVQVYIYKDEETDKVIVDSRTSDKNATQRSYTPLNFPIKVGDKISVSIEMHGLSVEGDTTKSIIWQNKFTKCGFFVYVPINYSKTNVNGEVYLSVNGLELGRMSFFSKIERRTDLFHSAQVETKIYEKVFISYSHKDDATVKTIAEAYKALGTVDYFYDRHTLSPGEIFEKRIYEYIDHCDLFILCWSKNAEKSEWVKKERVRAFYRAIDIPPKLKLYPINIPPYALPPSDLAKTIHFEDYDKLIDLSENQEESKE